MKTLITFLLLPLLASAQTVVTIPSQTVTVVIPAQTIALAPTPTCAPPQVLQGGLCTTPTSGSTFWVYRNGVFAWAGDYSWNGKVNYADTVGKPGSKVIAFDVIGAWGGWQPYSQNFDTTPYKYLQYCTKPTQAGEVHGTGFDANNDVADGVPIAIVAGPGVTKYGPVPTVGVWGCYRIPLADFGLTNPQILKFSVTDGTGLVPNRFYIDQVAFTN